MAACAPTLPRMAPQGEPPGAPASPGLLAPAPARSDRKPEEGVRNSDFAARQPALETALPRHAKLLRLRRAGAAAGASMEATKQTP